MEEQQQFTSDLVHRSALPFVLSAFLIATSILLWSLKVILANKNDKKGSKKRKIPGPPELPIFGHMFKIAGRGTEFFKLLHEWSTIYGDVCKCNFFGILKDVVLINDASMIQKLFSSPDHLERPPIIYERVFDHSETLRYGLTIITGEAWRHHRAITSRAFTYNALKSYIPIYTKYAKELVTKLETQIDSKVNHHDTHNDDKKNSTVVSLSNALHISTFQIISDVILGEMEFTEERQKELDTFPERLARVKKILTTIIVHPWMILKPIWWLLPISRELSQIITETENYFKRGLEEHKRKYIKKNDNVSKENIPVRVKEYSTRFQPMIELMFESGLSEKEILSEVATFFLAGHDTTSSAMYFLMYNLARNPQHQEMCRREVDEFFHQGDFSLEAYQQLKYLERCLKESMRIHPTIPIVARESQTGSLKLEDDLEIDPNTVIFVSAWALHRNPKYYPDPEKFDPDRFLPENVQKRSASTYQPFSSGKRDCIGWKLAMTEMTILAAWMIRHFEINLEPGCDPEKVKITFVVSLTTDPEVKFLLRKRNILM